MKALFVTGTGTEIGKTLVSIGLCLRFQADYWKPIQTGPDKDTEFAKKFLPAKKIHPPAYDFLAPASPNQAAQKENQNIEMSKIKTPKSSLLVIEGIGGVYVPLNSQQTVLDLIERLAAPALVVAQSGLGTLNHTLLTLFALRERKIEIAGVVLSGPPHKENKRDIERWGKAPILLELPQLSAITSQSLLESFKGWPSSFL